MSATNRREPRFSAGRRRFLAGTAASCVLAAMPALSPLRAGLFAGETARKRKRTVVVIYLRGGADALNVVIPYADELYHRMRPTLGIGAEGKEGAPGVIRLDERFGLHPALAGLEPWWKSGTLMPIVAAGSPHPTRSHFDAQDFMEYAAPGLRNVRDGWLNRWLAAHPAAQGADATLRALAMQRLLPRALRGSYPVLAVPERGRKELDAVLDVFEDLYEDEAGSRGTGEEEIDPMGERPEGEDAASVEVGRETIATLRRLNEILDRDDGDDAPAVKWPKTDFARRLERLSRVIRADAGLEATALDLGGWDTHVRQGATAGPMPTLLRTLGDGLGAFAASLGERLEDVAIVVMSEFGRTCYENGSAGTDHGHGGFMLVLGGGIGGGKVRGAWPGLADKKLYEGRDLQVTTDFREIFRELMEGFLGTPVPGGFFPSYVLEKKRLHLWS